MPVKRQNAGPSRGEKRTRFGSPTEAPPADGLDTEDAFLEEDIPEGTSTTKARQRRLVQDTDGYGSDSSNEEGEGVVPSRRPGAKDDEDDDVDMFAEDSDKKAGAEPSKGKGKQKDGGKEYMDLNEIEGQEFDDQPAQFGDAEYMSDEGEDEEAKRARKRLQVLDGGMGIDITPFNMKSEMEEGKFTADGETYQENERDPNEKHDTWLSNLDQEEIEKAKRAHEERERLERERQQKEDDLGAAKDKENEVMREAVKLMERGETVLEALQRLGKEVEDKRRKEEAGQKKKSWAERQKERKAAAEAEQRSAADEYHTSNPFTNLSNIVSTLTAIGHLDVYSLSRESLQRMLPAEPSSNGRPTSVQDDRQLQYRFSMAYVRNLPEAQRPVEREIFGPFSVSQLQQWRGTGFFGGPACENVELRTAPQPGQEASLWGSWAEVVEKAQ